MKILLACMIVIFLGVLPSVSPGAGVLSADRALAAREARQREQVEKDAAVKAALDQANAQVRESELLRKYAITSNDIERITGESYTKVQRDRAFRELWDRAKPDPEEAGTRWFFLPFPAGLRYMVEDVVQPESGCAVITLIALDKNNWQAKDVAGAYPADTFSEIGRALLAGYVDIKQLTLVTPPHDKGVEKLRKKQVVESGKWVIPVIVKSGGYVHVDSPVRIYVKDLAHLQETPLVYAPGKPLRDPPEAKAVPQEILNKEIVVALDSTFIRPIPRDSKTGKFLAEWYLGYRREMEDVDVQKKRAPPAWEELIQQSTEAEAAIGMGAWAGSGPLPHWNYVWEVEADGERHLLLTERKLSPNTSPSHIQALMIRALGEFNDGKALQRTPLVLVDITGKQ